MEKRLTTKDTKTTKFLIKERGRKKLDADERG